MAEFSEEIVPCNLPGGGAVRPPLYLQELGHRSGMPLYSYCSCQCESCQLKTQNSTPLVQLFGLSDLPSPCSRFNSSAYLLGRTAANTLNVLLSFSNLPSIPPAGIHGFVTKHSFSGYLPKYSWICEETNPFSFTIQGLFACAKC